MRDDSSALSLEPPLVPSPLSEDDGEVLGEEFDKDLEEPMTH